MAAPGSFLPAPQSDRAGHIASSFLGSDIGRSCARRALTGHTAPCYGAHLVPCKYPTIWGQSPAGVTSTLALFEKLAFTSGQSPHPVALQVVFLMRTP